MRTLTVDFIYEYNGEEKEPFTFEFSDNETEQEVKEAIAEHLTELAQEQDPEEEGEVNANDIELTDVSCDEDIDGKDTLKDIFEFAEGYCNCDQDAEVVTAALYCGVSPSDIDEAYNGQYSDDEDFAQEMAEQIGAIDKNATWPQNCIDWEYAAKELMYDYCEHNGHYFRNL